MGAIQMMNEKDSKLYESFNLEGINQSVYDKYYQEAVFIHGKETIKPIEKCIAEVHNELMTQLGIETDEKGKQKQANKANFDWDKFYKSYNFKNLEDEIQKIFGFRSVEIIPLKEEYFNKDKEFYYNCINAYTTMINRYPIDGLVTEKGFYDSTHSISLMITFTNTAIRDLTPGEFIGVLLHEIGHNCDPALVDIKYTQVNILSKYLTDRKDKITNAERKIAKKSIGAEILAGGIIIIFYILAAIMSIGGFKQLWRNIVNGIKNLFHIKISDSELNSRLERVKKQVEQDKKQFNRQEYSEAFADNFARMYGYGSELASALRKIDIETQKQYKSWYDLERNRQEAIIQLVKYTLQDEHKTEIHRIHALIREYKKDIEDKTLPKDVKKKMEDDLAELEAVYNSYTDDFDNFYKRCIEMMKEQLIKTDEAEAKKEAKENKKKEESVTESVNTKLNKKDLLKAYNKNFRSGSKSFSIWPWSSKSKENIVDTERCRKVAQKIYDDTKVDSIRLIPGEKISSDNLDRILDTKIGGIPYWPKDMKWPHEDNKPLICAAQLNFSKLPKLKDYPTDGILQFFIDDEYDYDVCRKLVYHKNPIKSNLLDTSPISTLQFSSYRDFPIHGVYYPTAKLVKSGLNIWDNEYSIDGTFKDISKLYEEYLKNEFGSEISKEIEYTTYDIYNKELNKDGSFGTRIGGWPSFTQADPRDKDHDILLLQLDSESDMIWGDMGIANFFISKKNLLSKNFNNVLFTWDCY